MNRFSTLSYRKLRRYIVVVTVVGKDKRVEKKKKKPHRAQLKNASWLVATYPSTIVYMAQVNGLR